MNDNAYTGLRGCPECGELEGHRYDCSHAIQADCGQTIRAPFTIEHYEALGNQKSPVDDVTEAFWTVVPYGKSFKAIRFKPEGEGCLIGCWEQSSEEPKQICAAHNAAVAAYQIALAHKGEPMQPRLAKFDPEHYPEDAITVEQEKLRQANECITTRTGERDAYKLQLEQAEQQLAAEREKYKFKANLAQEIVELKKLVEAAYKEGRSDGFDSVSATDKYNEERWQQSKAKHALEKEAK